MNDKLRSYLLDTLEVLPTRMSFFSKNQKKLKTLNPPQKQQAFSKPLHQSGSSVSPDLLALKSQVAQCQLCFLGARRRQFVHFGGPPGGVMILGEQPEFYDEVQGKYFSGTEGPMIEKLLSALGTSLDQVYVSATVKCASTQALGGNLNGIRICLGHLEKELLLVKPKMILGFGKLTYELITNQNDFGQQMGKPLFFQEVPICYTHGFQELLKDPELKKETWSHLKPLIPQIKALA